MTITGKDLADIGEVLYGKDWRSPFRWDFSLSERTLRRMLRDEVAVPTGMASELETALHDHGHKLDDLLALFIGEPA